MAFDLGSLLGNGDAGFDAAGAALPPAPAPTGGVMGGLPGAATPLPAAPATGLQKFQQVLKIAVPLLATAYALKKGSGLDAFAGGYGHQEAQAAQERDRAYQRRLQEDAIRRQIADEATRRAHEQRLEAAAVERNLIEQAKVKAAEQEAKRRQVHDALQRSVDKASENPAFMDKVNKLGPENFSLSVPGIGNINLADAFTELGVVKGPGGYAYGKPPAPEPDPYVDYTTENAAGTRTTERIKNSEAVKRGPHVTGTRAPKESTPKIRTSLRTMPVDPEDPAGPKALFLINDDTGDVIKEVKVPAPAGGSAKPGITKNDPLGIR